MIVPLSEREPTTRVMRLGLLTAAWERSNLTNFILRYYASLFIPGVELVPVVVVSPQDEDPCDPPEAWHVVRFQNSPLSSKWNAGLAVCADLDLDAVMIVGSDDMISASYITMVTQRYMRRPASTDFIQPKILHIHNVGSDYVYRIPSIPTGAGRMLSRRLLDAMKWQGWEGGIDAYLDASMTARVNSISHSPYTVASDTNTEWAIVDIKQEGMNMWQIVTKGRHAYIERSENERLRLPKVALLPADQFYKDHFQGLRYDSGQ